MIFLWYQLTINFQGVLMMKSLIRALGVLVLMVVFAGVGTSGAAASDSQDKQAHKQGLCEDLCRTGLKIRDQFQAILKEYQGIIQANQQLKEVGASFQKSLTAPCQNLSLYAEKSQQAVMAGVYTFDAGYSALFFRKKEMAEFLKARKAMDEKIGFTMALSPKMKQLLENPETIEDFSTWSEALDETAAQLLSRGLVSDKQLAVLAEIVYGMVVEGLYVVTESVALAGYPPEMLALMNHQHDRIDFFIKMLNTFRGDEAFEEAVKFKQRLDLISDIHNLMLVIEFTQKEVDGIREIITPVRTALIEGRAS
jgi:hypothetical protein